MRPLRQFIPPTMKPAPPAEDMVCTACGYSLRGFTRDDRCPECGVMTAWAVARTWQRRGDARWVRRMRTSLLLLFIAVLLTIGAATMLGNVRNVRLGVEPISVLLIWTAHLLAGVDRHADRAGHVGEDDADLLSRGGHRLGAKGRAMTDATRPARMFMRAAKRREKTPASSRS